MNTRLALIFGCAICSPAFAQYELNWHVVAGGGGTASGSVFELSFTTGQAAAGAMSGGDYSFTAGYWTGQSGPPPCPADFNDDGFLDFFDIDAYTACFEGIDCPPGKDGDFNHDGFIDFFDYDEYVVAFETGC